ncbi:methyltransferase domain-containing protein [Mycobacterium sp. 663a-19]|uniref:class I SAM-dependent methyltransferase n=1 Tax=Mycobacterium sp. 663a-19 TaxID=2986148 RepID=UPI002D1EF94E|nr:methyltransferase domain-containing protein [Mycobacterium sp. 663a-19]MEB3980338.1 methyltransferase domain-containing protein [Mycobacterium sp. 663a-19]
MEPSQVDQMALKGAVDKVLERFPFPDYFDPFLSGHLDMAQTVMRHLEAGSRVLDFGAGPADKTAILAMLGYKCTAVDDLGDEWHQRGDAKQKILEFAKDMGVEYITLDNHELPSDREFDMVMLHDVLEHLHDSPRDLLNDLLSRVRERGYLFITVPNHVNLRKRIAVLLGKTSHQKYEIYYWYPGKFRGHVREYTRGDCVALARALGLEVVELRGMHQMLQKVPRRLLRVYLAASRLAPSTRDTWLMVARKPVGWTTKTEIDDQEFRKFSGLKSWAELAH